MFRYITKDADNKWIKWTDLPKKVIPLDRTEPEYFESKLGDFEIIEPFINPEALPKNCLLFIELLE